MVPGMKKFLQLTLNSGANPKVLVNPQQIVLAEPSESGSSLVLSIVNNQGRQEVLQVREEIGRLSQLIVEALVQ
jgi:hypothetical protein